MGKSFSAISFDVPGWIAIPGFCDDFWNMKRAQGPRGLGGYGRLYLGSLWMRSLSGLCRTIRWPKKRCGYQIRSGYEVEDLGLRESMSETVLQAPLAALPDVEFARGVQEFQNCKDLTSPANLKFLAVRCFDTRSNAASTGLHTDNL